MTPQDDSTSLSLDERAEVIRTPTTRTGYVDLTLSPLPSGSDAAATLTVEVGDRDTVRLALTETEVETIKGELAEILEANDE